MFNVLPSGSIQPMDVNPSLSAELREAMLNVILQWASIDGAVSQLYTAVLNLNEVEHADRVSDLATHVKLRELQLHFRDDGYPDLARVVGRLKKRYERYSTTRDTIAHCRCVGQLVSEPNRAVFMRFRRYEDGLMIDAVHLDKFRLVEAFGKRLFDATLVTAADFKRVHSALSPQ